MSKMKDHEDIMPAMISTVAVDGKMDERQSLPNFGLKRSK